MFPRAAAFLDAARQGQNGWWRYLLGLLLILVCWLVIGSLPTFAVGIYYFIGQAAQGVNVSTLTLDDFPTLPLFLVTMLSFVFLLVGLWMAVRLVHNRPFSSLVTPEAKVNWRRVGQGFGVWFVLTAASTLVEALLYPGRYQLTFQLGPFVMFGLLALLFIPLQTSAEELLFRGYLTQMLGRRLRNPWLLSLITGLAFGALHLGNPEVALNFWLLFFFYVGFGVFASLITLHDGTLELALGLHAANNLFSALIATYPDGALRTPAVFSASVLDPAYNLVGVLVSMAIFALLLLRRPAGSFTPANPNPDSGSLH